VWDPDRDSGTEKPAAEAIEVDVPDDDAPETPMEAPPVAWTAEDQPAGGASAPEPATASGVDVDPDTAVDTGEPEPALVEAAAAGAVAQQQAAEPRRRRWGRDTGAEQTPESTDETKPNAPVVVFFILLGIVFAFVFLVAAVSTITHINDVRQARGQAPDANLSVYLRAIGDSSGYGVMAILCWVGAGIIGRLD
jgi:hypothetical protein